MRGYGLVCQQLADASDRSRFVCHCFGRHPQGGQAGLHRRRHRSARADHLAHGERVALERVRPEYGRNLAERELRQALVVELALEDDLRGVALDGHGLRGVILTGRDLIGANFRGAD